jgi:hypothetical protein
MAQKRPTTPPPRPPAGESYAGHYVPNLAAAIVDGNEAAAAAGDSEGHINLAGFLVGSWGCSGVVGVVGVLGLVGLGQGRRGLLVRW